MEATNSETQSWTFTKKVCFRFFFCFFVFQFFLSPALYFIIFGLNIPVYVWFEKMYAPLYHYINDHFLHLKQGHTDLKLNEFIFHIIAITTAIIATILWSVFDKQRKSYSKAYFWLRHTLKYVLAIVIFSYGMDKLIPNQMPMPDTYTLESRVGDFSPFNLFWTVMGSHPFYQSFTGLVEVTAALLLVFPTTYVVGLIVLTGTLINVLMLNIGFDISVTYYVIVLLTTCGYLLFPYLKSIVHFLLNKQQVQLYKQPKLNNSKPYNAIFIFSAVLFIISAVLITRDGLNRYSESVKSIEATKTFDVISQSHNSDTLKMVLGDKARWKYWIEYKKDDKNYISVLTMNDTVSYNLLFNNDTINKVIRLKPEEKSEDTAHYTFSYSIDNKKGDQTLTDSLHKMTLVIKELKKEDWELLKSRNKFFPFDF